MCITLGLGDSASYIELKAVYTANFLRGKEDVHNHKNFNPHKASTEYIWRNANYIPVVAILCYCLKFMKKDKKKIYQEIDYGITTLYKNLKSSFNGLDIIKLEN